MPYSTHDDLKELHEDIDELTSEISDFVFKGSGPNDMIPFIVPERKMVTAASVIKFWIQISAIRMTVNKIKWSDVGNALDWTGQDVIITGGVQYLNHGIAIQFNESFGHVFGDYWRFSLNPPNSNNVRIMAYNWVNDRLEPHTTVPIVTPSQTLVLAEANFATSLILRAKGREGHIDFRNEAIRLVDELIGSSTILTPEIT
jgi:hypothetical protein